MCVGICSSVFNDFGPLMYFGGEFHYPAKHGGHARGNGFLGRDGQKVAPASSPNRQKCSSSAFAPDCGMIGNLSKVTFVARARPRIIQNSAEDCAVEAIQRH